MYDKALNNLDSKQWEFFAEDLLWHIGFEIIEGPSEGIDGGKDLIVKKGDDKFLVSCKHYIKSGKSIGTSIENDILDRVICHDCIGFIAFYSTQPTSGLKNKFIQLTENNKQSIKIIELYKSNIFEIIPTMTGFVLQKYFSEPHQLYHHINDSGISYIPLNCHNSECELDVISKDTINCSRIQLVRISGKLELHYGCKSCISDYGESIMEMTTDTSAIHNVEGNIEIYWWEFTQIRYIEEFSRMNSLIDSCINEAKIPVSEDFYKNWSNIQSKMLQIIIPPHWGRWADYKKLFSAHISSTQ